ncbi:MAG: hypothetical protein KDC48_22230, partial [Planctomycetes bacterium]|nr:hypothetical protein [Planctomycetota bacterium]
MSDLVRWWDEGNQTWVALPAPPIVTGVGRLAATADGSLYLDRSSFGQPRYSGLLRWDGATWSTPGGLVSGAVWDMVPISGGDLLVAGTNLIVPGAAATGLARWDGIAWTAFPGLPNLQAVIELPNGDLVVGGVFQSIGGIAANYVARWNGTNWSPLGTGAPGQVRRLLRMSNGDLVAVGGWASVGGANCAAIARWNGTSWLPLGTGVLGLIVDLAEDRNG